MTTVDNLRNDLIDKIMTINNEDNLAALNNLLSAGTTDMQPFPLTEEQELMLQMSEDDIKYGRTVSQDEMKTKLTRKLHTSKTLDFKKSQVQEVHI